MARSQFTFKFLNAQPGAPVTFSAAVYSSPADATADGPTLALDSQRTVAVWTDATELTATWVDGAGASIMAEASLARPVVTASGGVPGTAPTAASGAPGAPRVIALPFAFDTPGLDVGYVTGYTPAAGDILLDAWVDVLVAFDGTSPKCDAGMFLDGPGDDYLNTGILVAQYSAAALNVTAKDGNGASLPQGFAATTSPANQSLYSPLRNSWTVPARFTVAQPIKIVANQTGQLGGAALDSTVGSAVFYLVVVTPTNPT